MCCTTRAETATFYCVHRANQSVCFFGIHESPGCRTYSLRRLRAAYNQVRLRCTTSAEMVQYPSPRTRCQLVSKLRLSQTNIPGLQGRFSPPAASRAPPEEHEYYSSRWFSNIEQILTRRARCGSRCEHLTHCILCLYYTVVFLHKHLISA